MRVVRGVVVAGLLLTTFLLPVQAQVPGTLNFTNQLNNSPGTCSSSPVYALGDTADAGKAYLACSVGGSAWWAYFDHVALNDYTVTGPLSIHAVMGCDLPTALASSPATSGIRFAVFLDGENLSGNINSAQHNLCNSTVTVDAQYAGMDGRTVKAGQTLRIGVMYFGPSPGAGDPVKNMHLRVGETGSYIAAEGLHVSPSTGPAAQTVTADLEAASVEHAFANATSDTYVLNFTTDLVNSTASFAWNSTSGNVSATLHDANGTIAFNGTLEGNGTLSHPISNATAGAWNLTLRYNGFTGNLTFALSAPPASSTPEATGEQPEEPEATGNETVDEAPKNEAPVPVLIPLGAVLGAAVLLRRRK